MADNPLNPPRGSSRVRDARGRMVGQLDPVAMYLLGRPGPIDPEALRAIAEELDPGEVRRRRWKAVGAVAVIILSYTAFFGYFEIFNRWRGWGPVLVGVAILYIVGPPTAFIIEFLRAKRRRVRRTRHVMLRHRHCPHCGYDIRGLPADEPDGATVCPECGCAWMLDEPQQADETSDG
jgi:predicted Zn-ribbon and HTH transcriptional regulator